jgi:hypothetical protein
MTTMFNIKECYRTTQGTINSNQGNYLYIKISKFKGDQTIITTLHKQNVQNISLLQYIHAKI